MTSCRRCSRRLEEAEDAVSRRRRVLHGRIDILRAERTAQVEGAGGCGELRDARLPRRSSGRSTRAQASLLPEASSSHSRIWRAIDDDALWAEIRRLETEEDDISLNRRVMHAQVDIVTAERAKRSRAGEHVDAGDLGSILGGGQ